MKNIYLNIYKPNSANLKKAKKNIKNNTVIGFPTETVYGLAGNAYSNKSVKKIFHLKKRPLFNPLIIHYKNLKSLKNDVIYNQLFIKLYKAFCPGPLTFILNSNPKSKISKIALAGKKTVAVRFPKHKLARKFLRMLDVPLAAPSANMSSRLSPTCAKDVIDEFGNKINIVLDGGRCQIGLESTIIDLTDKPTILRQGFISSNKIKKILKKKILFNKKSKIIKSPGQLKLHYSPGIPVYMNKKNPKKGGAFISFGKKFKNDKNYFNLSKKNDLNKAANNLYKTMRDIKKLGFKSISVCKIPNLGLGQAINDRLKKASNK
ncbi:L-threonylcarbamoyladenylate synthase [Pelagibacteraceae bacterium]|jgi:L-threonylcarbamoyladenylate synthase|nr:L-threonylcarbamoyladenylate synthase [Pelagibacteraceae bacterium]